MVKFADGINPDHVLVEPFRYGFKIAELTCDVCGKTYTTEDIYNTAEGYRESREFEFIRHWGGYGADCENTVFKDNVKASCDICQQCLSKLLGKYMRFYDPDERYV